MFLLTVLQIGAKVAGVVAATVAGALLIWVQRWARGDQTKPVAVQSLTHRTEVAVLAPWAIIAAGTVGWVAIGLSLGMPPWVLLVATPLVLWLAWWIPAGHRLSASQASIVVEGPPDRISAFVADIPGHGRWEPNSVSATPTVPGPVGPRFEVVERMPTTGQEITGLVELTRNDPGSQVVIQLVGAGRSGDYWSFAPQGGGTLVTQRSVVEVPYLLAVTGTLLSSAKAVAPGARERRLAAVQALKTAFEAQGAAVS